MEKEKETHNYLSKEEIKEKVHKYNSAVTDKLKMTLVSSSWFIWFSQKDKWGQEDGWGETESMQKYKLAGLIPKTHEKARCGAHL